MLDLKIAELSSTAGESNDGIVRGKVNQSLLIASLTNATISSIVYAIRRDANSNGFNFVDATTAAGDDTPDDFEPFGPTASFSNGDALFIACDHLIDEIYVKISTRGVYTASEIEFFDSSDGKTANRKLANVVDGSNGFRNAAGIYRIQLNHANEPHTPFSPVPGDIAERHWIVIKPKNITAVTTAPKLDRVWIMHHSSDHKYMDVTSVQNASMTNNVFGSFDTTVFPVIGSTHYYAFPFLTYGMDVAVFRKFSSAITRTAEYLASDNTWKTLPDWNDPTNGLTIGPATLGTTAENYSRRWTIPSDWAEKTLSFPMTDDTTKSITGYFVRFPITSITPYGAITRALWRARARSFGTNNSNGIYHRDAKTYQSATFDIGIPSSTETKIQLININTGAGTTITIPANTKSSGDLTGQRIDLNPALTLQAGQSLLIAHSSGGTLKDVELRLQ